MLLKPIFKKRNYSVWLKTGYRSVPLTKNDCRPTLVGNFGLRSSVLKQVLLNSYD